MLYPIKLWVRAGKLTSTARFAFRRARILIAAVMLRQASRLPALFASRHINCGRLVVPRDADSFHGLYGWLLPTHPSPANRGGVIFMDANDPKSRFYARTMHTPDDPSR